MRWRDGHLDLSHLKVLRTACAVHSQCRDMGLLSSTLHQKGIEAADSLLVSPMSIHGVELGPKSRYIRPSIVASKS